MAKNTNIKEKGIAVLVFNPLKRFIGVFRSCSAAANAFEVSAANIHFACTGKTISACSLYFRYWDNKQLTFEEVQNMSLIEWDKTNGLKRKYYPNKNMTRNGMKYVTHT